MPFFTKKKNKKSDSGDGDGGSLSIGMPFNVVRNYHVNFDSAKGEFCGLPPSWNQLLKNSNLT